LPDLSKPPNARMKQVDEIVATLMYYDSRLYL